MFGKTRTSTPSEAYGGQVRRGVRCACSFGASRAERSHASVVATVTWCPWPRKADCQAASDARNADGEPMHLRSTASRAECAEQPCVGHTYITIAGPDVFSLNRARPRRRMHGWMRTAVACGRLDAAGRCCLLQLARQSVRVRRLPHGRRQCVDPDARRCAQPAVARSRAATHQHQLRARLCRLGRPRVWLPRDGRSSTRAERRPALPARAPESHSTDPVASISARRRRDRAGGDGHGGVACRSTR